VRGIVAIAAGVVAVAVAVVVVLNVRSTDPDVLSGAVAFTCGEDAQVRRPLPLTVESVVLAGDSRQYAPCPGEHPETHREQRELELIERAVRSEDPALARAAVVAFGRIGIHPAGTDGALRDAYAIGLAHDDAGVRRAAAAALASALDGAVREPVSLEQFPAAAGDDARAQRAMAGARVAREALEARLAGERDEEVIATILESLGRLPYAADEDRTAVEAALAARLAADEPLLAQFGAAKGLEFLLRRSPGLVSATTIQALRAVMTADGGATDEAFRDARTGSGAGNNTDPVTASDAEDETASDSEGETRARIRRLALLALVAARDADADTLAAAARDDDWQVRRIAVSRLNADAPALSAALGTALGDPVFQVRLEAVRIAGRAAARSGRCEGVIGAIDDVEIPVVLVALDQLNPRCRGASSIVPRLEQLVGLLGAARDHWHVPARALAALARIAPDRARPQLDAAAGHPVWQVRAAAADVARVLGEEPTAVRLARDEEPNVRTSALLALGRLQSEARFAAALDALESADHDLIRTAAGLLEGAPDADAAVVALLNRLRRLTDDGADTSRDPRVAILRRLGDLMGPSQVAELVAYGRDVDPRVVAAAREAYRQAAGGAGMPEPEGGPLARYPYQPAAELLAALPNAATIELEGGARVELELLVEQAPVMVARFVELSRAGHYDGLTFHRVAPNFVIQGGSPGANEYSGVDRYIRDELGAGNWRGTVGLSTRGRDTGDGQFYVNLVDNPRLDHEYTVFARVTSGLEALDRLLEGARIASVRSRD